MNTGKLGSKVLRWLGFAAAGLLFAASAQAAVSGITTTKHNLSTTGTGSGTRVNSNSGTDQICVFCHTPHGSNTTAAVPLWNKTIPTTAVFTSYATLQTSSLNGEMLAVGSVSQACLSCHDGTQAMDNMMNAPGAGTAQTGTWNWTGANQTGGLLKAGIITNIGEDLRNDHPIGIQYCGGGLTGSGTTVSGTCADGDFINAGTVPISTTSDGRTATFKTATINNNKVFWIDLDGNSTRGKADINLYTRSFTGGANTPSVECGSCHDPHVASKDQDNIMFMRVTTAGSKICLSCHVK
jgi:predicted CXXCH cytochrome family protein